LIWSQGGGIDTNLTLTEGDSFDLDVLIDDVFDLAGFEFTLDFDDTLLSATSIFSGDVFGIDTFLIDDTISSNSVSFSETTFAFVGVDISTPTILATISFDTIASGASALDLNNIVLSDSFAFEINPIHINNGGLTINAASSGNSKPPLNAVPEPETLWLSFVGLMGLLISRRKAK